MSFLQMKPIFLPKKEVKQNNYDAAWKNQKPQFEREHGNLEKKSQFFSRVSQGFFSSQKKKKRSHHLSSSPWSLTTQHMHSLFLREIERVSFDFSFFRLKPQKENKVGNVKNLYTYRRTLPKYSFSSSNLGSLLLRFLLPISKSLLGFFFFFFNSTQNSTTPAMELGSGSTDHNIRGVPTHGGRYVQYNIYGNLFEVSRKYVPPIRPVGRGAYGIVWYGF